MLMWRCQCNALYSSREEAHVLHECEVSNDGQEDQPQSTTCFMHLVQLNLCFGSRWRSGDKTCPAITRADQSRQGQRGGRCQFPAW